MFQIHDIIDKHWCYGESRERRGKFPLNHLHKVDIPELQESESLFVSIAKFQGEQAGDLSFAEGKWSVCDTNNCAISEMTKIIFWKLDRLFRIMVFIY